MILLLTRLMRLWNSTSLLGGAQLLGITDWEKRMLGKRLFGIVDTVSFNVPDWDRRDHGGGVRCALQADYPPRVNAGQHELGGERR